MIKTEFTEFTNTTNWVKGVVYTKDRIYEFEAKLFDEGSEYGIKDGRVSKLQIWDVDIRRELDLNYATIVNYDRGWDVRPGANRPVFKAVMELLENSPKRFE